MTTSGDEPSLPQPPDNHPSLSGAHALAALMEGLRDQVDEVRARAAATLAEMDLPVAVDALIEAVRQRRVLLTNRIALFLAQHGGQAGAELLMLRASGRIPAQDASAAIFGLGFLQQDDSLTVLMDCVFSTQRPEINRAAIHSLARLGLQHFERLPGHLQHIEAQELARVSAWPPGSYQESNVLDRITWQARAGVDGMVSFARERQDEIVTVAVRRVLNECCASARPGVRIVALGGLAVLGDRDAYRRLLAARAERPNDILIRQQIVQRCISVFSPLSLADVIQLQRSGLPGFVTELSGTAFQELTAGLKDPRPGWRYSCIDLLAEHPDKEGAIALLTDLLDDPDRAVHARAARALADINHRLAFAALLRASGPEFTVATRCRALEGLGRSSDGQVLPLLFDLLKEPSHSLRRAAARALKRLANGHMMFNTAQALKSARAALAGPSGPAQALAALYLARKGQPEGIDHLIRLLARPSVQFSHLRHAHIAAVLELSGREDALAAVARWRESRQQAG